jgi:hypothetical protein
MQADRYHELLTAYVDGELSTRQRKAVLRLLHKSAEARTLLRQLQANADALRNLPRRTLGPDFPGQVLASIAQRGLLPAGKGVVQLRPAHWPTWAGWAAAAALLLSVSAASYFAFPLLFKNERHANLARNRHGGTQLAEKTGRPSHGKRGDRSTGSRDARRASRGEPLVAENPRKSTDGPVIPLVNRDGRAEQKSPLKKADARAAPSKKVNQPKAAEPDDAELLTGPLKDGGEGPRIARPNLSLMMELQDLGRKEATARLRSKLEKDNAYQVQMLCRDTSRAFDQLREVLKAQGIGLVIDHEAQARLKNPRFRTKFVIYAENLKPEELVSLMERLALSDRMTAARSKGREQFGVVLVNSLPPHAQRQLGRFLDGPAPPKAPARGKGPLGVDLRKPLSEGTARQVITSLKDRRKPAEKAGTRQVLVLAYNEDNSPVHRRASLSKEVKQFRAARQDRLPGTLQVVLVLSRDTV